MGQCGASFVRCFRTALSIRRELRSSTRYGAHYNSSWSCPADETTATGAQGDASLEKRVRAQDDVSLRARPPHLDQEFFSTGASSRKQTTHPSPWLLRVDETTTSGGTQVATSAKASSAIDRVALVENEMSVDEIAYDRNDHTAGDESEQSNIDELHQFLAQTTDAEAAWDVYEYLREVETYDGSPIPVFILRRMMVIIGFAKPHRRVHFLRLLNIANLLRQRDEIILLSEWNSLIACAGRGQRRKRVEDYQASLHVFRDMMAYSDDLKIRSDALKDADTDSQDSAFAPISKTDPHPESFPDANPNSPTNATVSPSTQDIPSISPDIQTYHILLHIAVMTNSDLAVRHASSLLLDSGLEPTQRTHAIIMSHYSKHNRNGAIRDSMIELLSTGVPIEPSLVNLCLWTYAKQGEMEIAVAIYQSLQANSSLGTSGTARDTLDDRLDRLIGFHIPRDVQPNSITYRVLAQAMAYHGDLFGALRVFRDFMESPSNLAPEPDPVNKVGGRPLYAAIMPMYRSLFLGFARHATTPVRTPDTDDTLGARLASFEAKSSPWNLENFFALFETFMALNPRIEQPSERLVYWIIVAVAKTSGSDMSKMWRVMRRIQGTFGIRWRGRLRRILESTSQGLDTGHVVAFPDDIVKRGGSHKGSRGRSFIS